MTAPSLLRFTAEPRVAGRFSALPRLATRAPPALITAAAAPKAGGDQAPSSSSSSKGFSTTTTAVPKKQKPRSNGRGALKRTTQGARLGKAGTTATPASTPMPSGPGEWVRLASLAEWREGKAGKAVTLPDGTVLCLFAVRANASSSSARKISVYATEIYSSAFKFPLVDAEVDLSSGSPIVTVPFDGTTYNLVDGSVVAWCPRNTPVRALLGAVKSRVDPTPIRVYPARVAGDGQGVEVWFAR